MYIKLSADKNIRQVKYRRELIVKLRDLYAFIYSAFCIVGGSYIYPNFHPLILVGFTIIYSIPFAFTLPQLYDAPKVFMPNNIMGTFWNYTTFLLGALGITFSAILFEKIVYP